MSNDPRDPRTIHGLPDFSGAHGLTQADLEIARHTGVAGVEIVEHKKRVALGHFKPGMLKPLAVILLAD